MINIDWCLTWTTASGTIKYFGPSESTEHKGLVVTYIIHEGKVVVQRPRKLYFPAWISFLPDYEWPITSVSIAETRVYHKEEALFEHPNIFK